MTTTIGITEEDRDMLVEGLEDTISCLENELELTGGGFGDPNEENGVLARIKSRNELADFLRGLGF